MIYEKPCQYETRLWKDYMDYNKDDKNSYEIELSDANIFINFTQNKNKGTVSIA